MFAISAGKFDKFAEFRKRYRSRYVPARIDRVHYHKGLGKWLEMGGSGIFRPEVTAPLGVVKPVLAWGLGLERVLMLRLGIEDIRDLYNNDLDWLRRRRRIASSKDVL